LEPGTALLAEDETDILLFPLLRAGWARRGVEWEVPISGKNARRVVFGALNLRSGHRLWDVRDRQKAEDFQVFLDLVRERYRRGPVALLLDEDSSHTDASSQSLADDLDIGLIWLPKRAPKLNPLDTLWGQVKDPISANFQHETVDHHVARFLDYLVSLSPAQALRLAGIRSKNFWLSSILCK
jgi:hypothetical protein